MSFVVNQYTTWLLKWELGLKSNAMTRCRFWSENVAWKLSAVLHFYWIEHFIYCITALQHQGSVELLSRPDCNDANWWCMNLQTLVEASNLNYFWAHVVTRGTYSSVTCHFYFCCFFFWGESNSILKIFLSLHWPKCYWVNPMETLFVVLCCTVFEGV